MFERTPLAIGSRVSGVGFALLIHPASAASIFLLIEKSIRLIYRSCCTRKE
jgi:hypothetical protein